MPFNLLAQLFDLLTAPRFSNEERRSRDSGTLKVAPLRRFVHHEGVPDANDPHRYPDREPLLFVFTPTYSPGGHVGSGISRER